MKKMNKLFAMILAVAMIASFALSASAATTYTVTINNTDSYRTYAAYQIFAGDVTDTEMTNIVWGAGITEEGKTALMAEYGVDSAADLALLIQVDADAAALAEKAAAYLATASGTSSFVTDEKEHIIENLDAGYYLVKETTQLDENSDASISDYMMKVVKNVELSPKVNAPSIEKKVSDINDSEMMNYENLLKSADHDIGDDVPFHIHVKLGDGIENYTEYKLIVTDTMDKGLTFNNDLVVMFGTHEIPATSYTLTTATNEQGATVITITFEDLFNLLDADGNKVTPHNGGNITLDYTAELNENAIIGSLGNKNKVYMDYSNNPNSDGMGRSAEDTVIVFTYQMIVDKTDGTKPLEGAAFALYKNDYDGEWDLVQEYTVTAGQTTFEFKGLDDGEYKLVETETPSGYNTIEDQFFKVVASHDDSTLTLTSLSGEKISGTIELTHDQAEEALKTTIVNEKGALLPSTGGMGTTIFYIAGSILAFSAIVLLVTKKRMGFEA